MRPSLSHVPPLVSYPVWSTRAVSRFGATPSAVSSVMRGNRSRNSRPEVALRSALHRRGLRYRTHYQLNVGEVRVRPDVVFTRKRLAVFVDGCFWHSCPEHHTVPRTNEGYWLPKLRRNIERDRRVDEALRSEGWRVLRVWEHEEPGAAAKRVAELLRSSSNMCSSVSPGGEV